MFGVGCVLYVEVIGYGTGGYCTITDMCALIYVPGGRHSYLVDQLPHHKERETEKLIELDSLGRLSVCCVSGHRCVCVWLCVS